MSAPTVKHSPRLGPVATPPGGGTPGRVKVVRPESVLKCVPPKPLRGAGSEKHSRRKGPSTGLPGAPPMLRRGNSLPASVMNPATQQNGGIQPSNVVKLDHLERLRSMGSFIVKMRQRRKLLPSKMSSVELVVKSDLLLWYDISGTYNKDCARTVHGRRIPDHVFWMSEWQVEQGIKERDIILRPRPRTRARTSSRRRNPNNNNGSNRSLNKTMSSGNISGDANNNANTAMLARQRSGSENSVSSIILPPKTDSASSLLNNSSTIMYNQPEQELNPQMPESTQNMKSQNIAVSSSLLSMSKMSSSDLLSATKQGVFYELQCASVEERNALLVMTRGLHQPISLMDLKPVAQIGTGHFGRVLMVKHRETGTPMALKAVPLDRSRLDMLMVEKLVLERASTAKCKAISRLLFSFYDSGALYFACELCPSGDLWALLRQKKVLPENTVRFVAAELVSAIHCLHTEGIVHRDIKPENILLTATGHVKLTDFGLAKFLSLSTIHLRRARKKNVLEDQPVLSASPNTSRGPLSFLRNLGSSRSLTTNINTNNVSNSGKSLVSSSMSPTLSAMNSKPRPGDLSLVNISSATNVNHLLDGNLSINSPCLSPDSILSSSEGSMPSSSSLDTPRSPESGPLGSPKRRSRRSCQCGAATAENPNEVLCFCERRPDYDRSFTICGTSFYMAPEMIRGAGHGLMVDWWQLGCVVQELLTGTPAFQDSDPQKMEDRILFGRPNIIPDVAHGQVLSISDNARDFIRRLLATEPRGRLGNGATRDVSSHPFFTGVNWVHVQQGLLEPTDLLKRYTLESRTSTLMSSSQPPGHHVVDHHLRAQMMESSPTDDMDPDMDDDFMNHEEHSDSMNEQDMLASAVDLVDEDEAFLLLEEMVETKEAPDTELPISGSPGKEDVSVLLESFPGSSLTDSFAPLQNEGEYRKQNSTGRGNGPSRFALGGHKPVNGNRRGRRGRRGFDDPFPGLCFKNPEMQVYHQASLCAGFSFPPEFEK